jgi:hypothetical protein
MLAERALPISPVIGWPPPDRERLSPPSGNAPGAPPAGNGHIEAAQLSRMTRHARRALSQIAPFAPISERAFRHGEIQNILLAVALPYGHRLPRSPDLIRLAVASGAGLRFRAFGRLSVVTLQLNQNRSVS